MIERSRFVLWGGRASAFPLSAWGPPKGSTLSERLWTKGSSTSIPPVDTPNGTTSSSWGTYFKAAPGIPLPSARVPIFPTISERATDPRIWDLEPIPTDLILESIEGSLKRLKLGTDIGLAGLFCQQCRQCCQPQCPAGLEIPRLMRAYMYAFGHEKPEKTRETLRGWISAGLGDRDCAAYTVRCALGFDVKSRALELADALENV